MCHVPAILLVCVFACDYACIPEGRENLPAIQSSFNKI